ncbi:MAG: hypothetical protein A2W31_11260 [Planctomycetes bacterium RBG_16_64_10]|nr:MAG: hypothetical protein A2W31_11260 [Planctomycetes bacterium RBG_16_64_10]
MKGTFFVGVFVLLPVVVIGGGIIYLAWRTCYALYDDWRLNRELAEIRAASQAKRQRQGAAIEDDDPSV